MAIRIQNPKPSISIHPTITPFKTHFNSHNLFITIPPRTGVLQIQPPSLSITRRSFLPSVSGIWDAITGGNNAREAIQAIRRGMLLFRQGDVSGSLVEFDKAIELDPRQKAYLWQRGLSLYYVNRFEEGAEQFRIDVAQNPNDTEESIWCFLCEAQLYGADEARRRFLEVGRDPRPVMREAYNVFRDGGDPEKSCTIHGAQTGRYGEAGCGREGADGGVGSGLVPDGQADPANSGGNRWVEGGDEKPDRRGPRGTAPAGRSHGLLASSVRERAGARGSGPA